MLCRSQRIRSVARSFVFCLITGLFLLPAASPAAEEARLKLMFLGDNGHHQPAVRFKQLQPVMAERGIDLVYSDLVSDLNPETLKDYAGVVIYANTEQISPEQEAALIDFVEQGKGLIPLHCASFCFLNSPKYIALVGAQFQRHDTGTFRTILAAPDHPVMRGFRGFESWDETYVHTKHNTENRTVLEYRQEGDQREPWTWVRTQGRGRIFYTAWGHDQRTWSHPGFQNLVERGIRWAVGSDLSSIPDYADRPEMTTLAKNLKPFQYVDANIPFYPPNRGAGRDKGPRQMQLPVSPEESMQHLVTPKGFNVELFASEANFGGKPIAMNWDERGRLWMCETVDYPNELQPANRGRDRIRICEDTDHDGVADKFTVFAENLSIPATLVPYRGGVVVQNGTETLYLKDLDGDDKADLRKVLVTGWALGDTHGGVSNFQYGLDNWYYGMQGYNNSEPVLTDGRKITSFRMGFFRFKLTGDNDQTAVSEMEFLRSTNNNTWGLGISEEGLIFGSTANGNPSEFMPIPNRYYEGVRGWGSSVLNGIADSNDFDALPSAQVRQVDHHGGFTAAAGHALYTARNYPREYWNRTAFVTEPTGHLVATFVLREEGAGYRSRNSWNLLASDDEWTSPIMAEVGPDGNVWVIDWYNYIVQHNPTPAGFSNGKGNAYESELRDKKHGRIYRLTYTGENNAAKSANEPKPAASQPATNAIRSLAGATPEQLVAALESDNFFWRRQAQRLLVERGQQDVVPGLIELVKAGRTDAIGLAPGAVHALQTLHGLGVLDGQHAAANDAVLASLSHTSPAVRRNAVQVLPRTAESISALLAEGRLAKLLNDSNQQVRLAAWLALADLPSSDLELARQIQQAMASTVGNDRWLRDASVAAAARNAGFFLRSVLTEATQPAEFSADALAIVAEHYARGTPSNIVELIIVPMQTAPAELSTPILAGIVKGWPKSGTLELSTADDEALVALLNKLPPVARGGLVSLAVRWGSQALEAHVAEISQGFLEVAGNSDLGDGERITAARQLIEFRRLDEAITAELLALISARSSADLSQGLLEAVGLSEAPAVGSQIVEAMAMLTPSVRPVAIRLLLSRTDWTTALLDGLEAGQLQLTELTLDQKQALSTHVDKTIRARAKPMLAQSGGLPNPDRQKVVEELLPLTQIKGDAVAGKEVFKKTCAKCHMHSGEGTKIGPDLTGMAVHPKQELLIHIIDPSRSVEGNFRIYTVVTDDGKVYSGLLASESKTTIELIDSEAKKHQILRENIEQLVASPKSLMPEGFEKQHTKDELGNLLEFLAQRGKFLPLPLEKVATAVSTRGMFIDERSDVERLIFRDWNTRTVDGIPFSLIDPRGDQVRNTIVLHSFNGPVAAKMPREVRVPCNAPAKAIHFLGGVSGWGFPFGEKGTTSMIVRLHYADGKTEDHPLKNGEHFADYIRRVDVPDSKFVAMLRGQQIRYLSIHPGRTELIQEIELRKGPDASAPVVMAVTVESP